MRTSLLLAGVTAVGLSCGVLAGPQGPATAGDAEVPVPAASARVAPPGAVRAVHRYRLVTGDTVRVLTRADGTNVPRVLGRTPFVWSGGAAAMYVVPRRAASRLHALDLSLFDTVALAQVTRHGRTPVVVRLVPGAGPATIPGLRLVPGTARKVGGSTVVHGTYGQHFRGFTASDLRRISWVRLDAPRPPASDRASTGPTHTVQVQVLQKDGSAPDYAMVTLQNTVDGDSYLQQTDVDPHGLATFPDVPEGEYSAVVMTFDQLLVDRQFEVASDRTIQMNLGDATVKPQVTLAGHHPVWTSVSVERDPERGFGIPFGAAGPHFDLRVQPTPGWVRHGALHTGVTATLVTGRASGLYRGFAMTADAARGVPAELTFVHHRRDFARMTDLFYGNGPAADRTLMLFPGNTHTDLFSGETDVQVPVPGRFRLWYQAGPGSYLQQTVFPLAKDGSFDDNTQVGDVRLYRKPGPRPPLRFLHGPVGPGLELAPLSPSTSGAVRRGDRLQMFVPVLGGAGGPSFDFADRRDASWSLHLGRRTLAHGHEAIEGNIAVPHGPRTYRLFASTHPGRAWDLSTRVTDIWTFHSRAGRAGVPLLTPSYVPPTDLAGDLGPGRTWFRLAFHSTPHSARVVRATLELSTNGGRTWHHARVTRTSALTFRIGYRNPAAHRAVRYMSLRVTARDAHGNTVRETAIRAYRLR